MQETNKGVETKVESAPIQSEDVVTQTATEVDYEAELAKVNEQLAKTIQEKENYRKGLLKAKGKLPEEDYSDDDSSEDADSRTRRIVQETILSTKEAQLQAQKDALQIASLKRIKELELALKNRGQISTSTAQGSNQEKQEGKVDNYLSNEQIAYFKAKGWDDKKIEAFKENAKKIGQMPR